MRCNVYIWQTSQASKQASEWARTSVRTFHAHNFASFLPNTSFNRVERVDSIFRMYSGRETAAAALKFNCLLPRVRHAFDELKPLPQLTRVRAIFYSIFLAHVCAVFIPLCRFVCVFESRIRTRVCRFHLSKPTSSLLVEMPNCSFHFSLVGIL